MPTVSGNVGAVGPFAGTYLPVADATGVTVDTTTYSDSVKGSGKLTTLIFPADQSALAIAIQGDAFPRWVLAADPTNFGLLGGDGTSDPVTDVNSPFLAAGQGHWDAGAISLGTPTTQAIFAARLVDVSPRFTITSGALPTVQLVSGAGAQVSTSRDVEAYTPLTLTTAGGTVVVALSADNVTYSTVMTVTPAVNASVTDVTVRVPAGWYLKMTATNATLGLTTYA